MEQAAPHETPSEMGRGMAKKDPVPRENEADGVYSESKQKQHDRPGGKGNPVTGRQKRPPNYEVSNIQVFPA